MQAASLSGDKDTILKLANDLRYAAKALPASQWRLIILEAVRDAAHETTRSKVKIAKKVSSYLGKKIKVYAKNPEEAAVNDIATAIKMVWEIPDKVKDRIAYFQSISNSERIEVTIVSAITLMIFFSVAGGCDLEGGVPDMDLSLGIGNHRNVLFHSILPGLGLEFIMRLASRFLLTAHLSLPTDHHPVWDNIQRIIQKTEKFGIAAIWLGLGAHLLKDAALFSGNTKPLVGIPGSHSMAFHKSFLAVNGSVSEIVGGNEAFREVQSL